MLFLTSRQYLFDHVIVDVGQPEIAPLKSGGDYKTAPCSLVTPNAAARIAAASR